NEKQYKERRKLEEAFKLEEEQRRREETRKYDEERRKLDEELIRQKEESRKLEEERRKDTRKISAFVQSQSDAHSIYRSALVSGWANGVPTGERKTKLDDLRSALGISMEEHAELEKEVKHQTYMEAFKRIWVPSGKASSGWDDDLWRQALKRARSAPFITPARAAVLDQLREKFQVSTEEHLQIEAKLLAEIQTTSRKPTVVVIDDDEEFLQVVVATLEDAGLGTKAFTTSDEAFEMLKTSNPDLILCDINLPKSTMGGFTFYEKLKQLQHLKFVPFIFLTGYSDESLARKGKELGVDDFLTKPFNDSHLISTIKGKIRRYRELRSK
ncbi:MAG: response regulator, partial [Ignavibacteriales bacterium]|nr:response regulator [Ignavibacteriales bacterium]